MPARRRTFSYIALGAALALPHLLPGPWPWVVAALVLVMVVWYGERAARRNERKRNQARHLASLVMDTLGADATQSPAGRELPPQAQPSARGLGD